MSLSDVFNVAASALSAQSQRLNATASNMANAESAGGPNGEVYKARQVVFEVMPVGQDGQSAGVRVSRVVEDDSAPRRVYDPQHPLADSDGYVNMPNVNPIDEMVNMISASRSYQNNVEVMNTAKTLMSKLLTLGN